MVEIGKKNDVFLSELIWREFFINILYHFLYVVNESFRKDYVNLKWRNNLQDFERWRTGTTGFPLVDAGMRQLNETGYMHNRVRMVCASFLVKHLLIDWRWGERYFADKLIDYDLASNNGNWQWVAGCGTDAAPYFRIFNPIEQQKKFDPDGIYISQWIKEYKTSSYPKPMIDLKSAYQRAIEFFGKK
jgi:deoxyribodipyrimidine photo-lyase